MLYPITRPFATIALSVFFRKLYLSGLENLDWSKPLILASNHPTAFIEPCILACWLPKPLHFMTRGDLFLNPVSNWILRDFNMIPLYRMGDAGVAGVKENFRSVEETVTVLRTLQPVHILAEGHTVHEKRLRPLRKGTARIALAAQDKNPELDIQLIPVGVNYTYADRFRSEVMIHFGNPISVRDHLPAFKANAPGGMKEITEALRRELEKHVVVIREKEDEGWTDHLLLQYRNNRNDPFAPHTEKNSLRLAGEKAITDRVNSMEAEEKARWKGKVENYHRELARFRSSDRALAGKHAFSLLQALALVLGAPLYAFSFLIHGLPLGLAWLIGYGKWVPRYEFKASVALAAGLVIYVLLGLILIIAGALLLGWKGSVFLLIIFCISGGFMLLYADLWKKCRTFLAFHRIPADAREALKAKREEIGEYFGL